MDRTWTLVDSGAIRTLGRALVWLVVIAAPGSADAQYFGRNKVEYTDFDFRVLSSEHFDVYYYPREEQTARLAARLPQRSYARHKVILNLMDALKRSVAEAQAASGGTAAPSTGKKSAKKVAPSETWQVRHDAPTTSR